MKLQTEPESRLSPTCAVWLQLQPESLAYVRPAASEEPGRSASQTGCQ